MLVKSYSAAVHGVDACLIVIEVNAGGPIIPGKNNFFTVGLPDNAIREGAQRIESAMKNSGRQFPRIKLIINLAPADIRKEGSAYDLPIALGILGVTGQLETEEMKHYLIMGELSLDGGIRPVKGILPMAILAAKKNLKGIIIPKENAREAAIVSPLSIIPVGHLNEAIDFISGIKTIEAFRDLPEEGQSSFASIPMADFSEVRGQENIKRALEIAAAGGHNAILIGPPGAGKTMLAQRMPGILPPISIEEALETTKIHSVAGILPRETGLIKFRPFRSPHHTISDVALVGGGSNPSPGEISLAHNGVLFLDELPEFKRQVLEVLRQPMEDRKVTISRARISLDYPSSFMLLASMNPCPCGFYNHPDKECVCGPGVVKKYLSRISGPLLDRIDLHVEVTPVSSEQLMAPGGSTEKSEDIRERVLLAREKQAARFSTDPRIHFNAQIRSGKVRDYCNIDDSGQRILKTAMNRLQLSARAYDRILKVARTIADLEGEKDIQTDHLSEAIHFRSLDREGWAG